jgi:rubredoxin
MTDIDDVRCPGCGAALQAGFIGCFSGIMWHDKELKGWKRLFPFVLTAGHFVVSNAASTPWIRSREALKCRDCGTLVVPI